MRLERVATLSRRIAGTGSRRAKVETLAALLGELGPREIPVVVSWLSGSPRQGRIGVGPALLQEALARTRLDRVGDPGQAPDRVRSGRAAGDSASRPRPLTVAAADRALAGIGEPKGPGSNAERARLLAEMLARATPGETDFLAGLLVGELRQGALEGIMIEALARASGAPAAMVRRALMLSGDLAEVAVAALEGGEESLVTLAVRPFRPLRPMLARTADGVADALDRLGTAALEYKLDGARIQVHRVGDEVRVYTRRLNDVTDSVPEVVEAVGALEVERIVLDGEAVALLPDGSPHPFQVTMRRFGRKLDVARLRRELPLSPFFFDCLLLDGELLIDRPAEERFARFRTRLPEGMVVPRIVTADPEQAAEFLEGAIASGHEGLVAKGLRAPYEAGARGGSWLKVKPVHTVDLVVLAAEWGSGRRQGWLSNLHLGARDPAGGAPVMVGKTFKGMTDEILDWQTGRLQELAVDRRGREVRVRPELVVEVAIDGVQTSPGYPAGLALRFARLRGYRPDKDPSEADSLDRLRAIRDRVPGPPCNPSGGVD